MNFSFAALWFIVKGEFMSTLNTVRPRAHTVLTRARRESRRAYFIIIPILGYLMVWNLIPLIYGVFLGFTSYNGLGGAPKWVGLKNFITVFTTSGDMTLLWRQIWLGFVALLFNLVFSFILALALNVNSKIKGLFRTAIYIPNIAAVTATTAVFVALLNPLSSQGLNKIITSLGGTAIAWNYSSSWMVFWIILYFVWRNCGPSAIIWLGGLQGIDPSLYEAAKVDGANFFDRIRYITIPGLKFVSMYLLLTGIIGAMQMFDVVMFISNGGPYQKTDVLMYKIYRNGIVNFNLGMAGAESLVLGIATIIFAFIYLYFQQKSEDE